MEYWIGMYPCNLLGTESSSLNEILSKKITLTQNFELLHALNVLTEIFHEEFYIVSGNQSQI